MSATPTPGALRAASMIQHNAGLWSTAQIAKLIDAETGAGELLTALEAIIESACRAGCALESIGDVLGTARDALARARGACPRGCRAPRGACTDDIIISDSSAAGS